MASPEPSDSHTLRKTSNENKNSGRSPVGIVVGGLSIIAGIGVAAFGFYQQYKDKERQRRAERRVGNPYPSVSTFSVPERDLGLLCTICNRVNSVSKMFLLSCNHQFHCVCLAANYALKIEENPTDGYRCPTCNANVTDGEIDAFTKDYQIEPADT